jgi:preprotein translocase subunit SecG
MLSFMREQGAGNAAESAAADTGPQNARSPDSTGPQEFLTVATTRKSLRRSTMVVVILLVVGLVCLWMMIRRVQPQAAAAQQGQAEQARIEDAIGRLTGASTEMVDRMDAIVKKFYEFSDVFQVKASELAKNPFEVEGFVKDFKGIVVVAEDPLAQAEMVRRQRLQQQALTLRLVSIMRAESGPCCMINDQVLRQGERIEDFTVRQIGSNFVELVAAGKGTSGNRGSEAEEMTITLKLSQ